MDLIYDNLLEVANILSLRQGDQKCILLCLGVVISFINYVFIYQCLSRLVKNYVVQEGVPKINQIRLINAVWRVLFSVGIVTLFFTSLWDTTKPQSNILNLILQSVRTSHCNVTLQHQVKDASSREFSLLVAPVTFFLHQVYVSISEGSEPALVSMGCFAMFVFAADPVRCPNLCIQVLFLLSLSMGTLELAKVFYILKSRSRGFEGPPAPLLLRRVAPILFAMHIAVWAMVNFYLLPVLYISLPSVSQVDPRFQTKTAFTNIFLLFLIRHQFFDLPAWSLLKLMIKKPSEIRRIRSIASLPAIVLLPYTSSLLPELRAIQLSFLLNALPTSAERRMLRKKLLSSGSQTSTPVREEKADFLSFIKCVKILKRKMRHRYEQKVSNEVSIQEGSSESEIYNSEHGSEGPEGQSESDITDIFVPVPSTSFTADINPSHNVVPKEDRNNDDDLKET